MPLQPGPDVRDLGGAGYTLPAPTAKATARTTTTIELAESRALTAEDLLTFVTALPGEALRDEVSVDVQQGDNQRDGSWFKITGRWTR